VLRVFRSDLGVTLAQPVLSNAGWDRGVQPLLNGVRTPSVAGPGLERSERGLKRIKATLVVLAVVTAAALSSTSAFAWGTPSPSQRPTHSPTQSPDHSPTQSPTESPTKPPASPTITVSPTSAETSPTGAETSPTSPANVAATSLPSPPVTGAGPGGDGGFSALLIALSLIILAGGGLTLFFSRGSSSTS
jgi:hypothetical protein